MPIVFIFLLSLLLFKNSFTIYFFQDDWFLLFISKINNLEEFLRFFIPRSDVQFYRPLSHEIFYFISRGLFSLNPLGFHIIVWIFFLLNIILIWKLSQKFISNKFLQQFLIFLYATSAIHYNSLNWIINFSYVLVSFWYLLGFLLFLSKSNLQRNHLWLLIIYTFGLLSSEFMITFPIMLIVHTLLFNKKHLKKYLFLYTVLLIITLFYLITRLFIFKPDYGSYRFVFDKSVISSYRFFLMFFLNWPETMKDQMVSWYRINASFLTTFSQEIIMFAVNLVLFMLMAILLPFIRLVNNKKYLVVIQSKVRNIVFAIFWFLIALLPIIFIPSHISPHQGIISLFGFLLILTVILESYKIFFNKYIFASLMIIFGTSWVLSSYISASLNDRIHWIKRRSDLSKYWVTKIKSDDPSLPPDSIIHIPTQDKEVMVALSDGRAFNEIYNDSSIRVIFKVVP